MAATSRKRWWVFAIACSGTFLVSLDSTIAVAAFPSLRAGFPAATPADLSWTLNAYTIVFAALLIPFGRLVDKTGARSIFLWGVALFGASSLACGLATTPSLLVAARVVQAVGGAMLTPASLTLILGSFPADKRSAVVGLWSAVGALAAALGPGLGGLLIEAGGWRMAFLVNIPIAAGLILAARSLDKSPGGDLEARIDYPGTFLLIVALGAMTFGIVSDFRTVDTFSTSFVALGTGAAAALAYVMWAKGRKNATIDLGL